MEEFKLEHIDKKPALYTILSYRNPFLNPIKTQSQLETYNSPPCSRYITDFKEVGVLLFIFKTLGKGHFSVVYICENRLDGCKYAIKKITAPITTETERYFNLFL